MISTDEPDSNSVLVLWILKRNRKDLAWKLVLLETSSNDVTERGLNWQTSLKCHFKNPMVIKFSNGFCLHRLFCLWFLLSSSAIPSLFLPEQAFLFAATLKLHSKLCYGFKILETFQRSIWTFDIDILLGHSCQRVGKKLVSNCRIISFIYDTFCLQVESTKISEA